MTLATELSVLCASFVLLKVAAAYAGPAGFGEFVVARRLIGWIQLPTLAGMALGLTRSVAMTRARGQGEGEWAYLDAALLVAGTTTTVVVLALLCFSPVVAQLGMGDRELAGLARAMAPGVAGLVLHAVAYGLLRGRRSMVSANALQAINLGMIPLLAFAIPGLDIARLVLVTGAGQACIAVLVLIAIRRAGPAREPWRAIWQAPARELLRYGVPRIPGEFILGALTALPVTAAAHYGGSVAAGQIGLGQSVLTLLGALFAPLGQVMLPSISARVASGEVRGVERSIWLLVAACLGLTFLGVIAIYLLAPWLIPFIFGAAFSGAVGPIRIMVLGAVPYVAYVVLRNVLDAIHAAPLNAANLAVALLVFGAALGVGRSLEAVPVAAVASMIALGLLTAWRAHRALRDVATAAASAA
ncbi:MAG TPA: lipopolysaccharide biosynthesis protein [Gemmatimonadales bacterium]|nr:lipopolysaccharide biosynthesis protein [Gemmatimonadales bacterium]